MKKIILLLVFLGFNILYGIADDVTSFKYNGLSYTITSDSTVMVINDYDYFYRNKIVVPSEIKVKGVTYRVTALDKGAFQNAQMTYVEIPSTITEIPDKAFSSCNRLTDIVLPESIEKIGSSSFRHCSSLTHFELPQKVTIIESYAFCRCDELQKVVLPSCLQTIVDQAFLSCSKLQEIIFPNTLKTIGQEAFKGCTSLREVLFPASLEKIGQEAFAESGLCGVTICDGLVSELPYLCFSACKEMKSVVLSGNITHVGSNCFEDCINLTEVTLAGHLQEIGAYAFKNCSSLKEVHMGNEVKSIRDAAFSGCSSLFAIDFGNSIESISGYAFAGCNSLQSIDLPATITTIGGRAFYPCGNLMKVTSHASHPAKCSSNTFGNMTYWFSSLVVPEASKNQYIHAEGWKHFESVEEESGNSRMVSITCSGEDGGISSVRMGNQAASKYKPLWTSVPDESLLSLIVDTNSNYSYSIVVNDVNMTDQVVDNQLTIPSVTEDLNIKVSFDYRKFILSLHQDEGGSFNLHETGRYKLKVVPHQDSRIVFIGFDGHGDISSWALDEQKWLNISTEYVDTDLVIVFEKENHEEE